MIVWLFLVMLILNFVKENNEDVENILFLKWFKFELVIIYWIYWYHNIILSKSI